LGDVIGKFREHEGTFAKTSRAAKPAVTRQKLGILREPVVDDLVDSPAVLRKLRKLRRARSPSAESDRDD
jgi:hypothetical protein